MKKETESLLKDAIDSAIEVGFTRNPESLLEQDKKYNELYKHIESLEIENQNFSCTNNREITQKEFIIKRILENGSVTRNYALRNYISRLGSIICNLQKDGYIFEGEYFKVKTPFGDGKDYRYTVSEESLIRLEKDFKELKD